MEKSLHLVISGRVQGVGFRAWTKQMAEERGLRGSVWNRSDGKVEVLAAGEETAIEEFLLKLHSGPPGSRVDSVQSVEESPSVTEVSFEISRSR